MAKWIAHFECPVCGESSRTPRAECPFCKNKLDSDFVSADDVRRVVRSHWEDVEVERVEDMENPPDVIAAMFCPNCNRWHNEVYFYGSPTEDVHFCPFCGATMNETAIS